MSLLKSLEVTNSKNRISSIDILRCIAIIFVMLTHFNNIIPFGYIGVDLFFVISGILVGGILINETVANNKISFWKFIIQRGFKIWPSYFLFIFLGHWLDGKDIGFESNAKYIFFYQNYSGDSSHLWSLCVEEHFYIMLPILFILVQQMKIQKQFKYLQIGIFLMIIAGILFKFASYYFTYSQDTNTATHNRIDALAWGVLFSYQIASNKIPKKSISSLLIGISVLVLSLILSQQFVFFQKLLLHSFIPFSFFLIARGIYYIDFSRLKIMRLIAYYSYNIFLWHAIIGGFVMYYFGSDIIGVSLYILVSFLIGIIVTVLVEEPFLKWRKKIMRYFPDKKIIN